jgi:hypothetical protein
MQHRISLVVDKFKEKDVIGAIINVLSEQGLISLFPL